MSKSWDLIKLIWKRNYASKMTKNNKALSLLSVLGSGGHTTEMLALVESLDHDKYRRTFVHANTDSMSAKKLAMLPSQTNIQVIIFEIFYYILVFLCQLFLHFRFVRFPELAKLVKVGFHHWYMWSMPSSSAFQFCIVANQMWFWSMGRVLASLLWSFQEFSHS